MRNIEVCILRADTDNYPLFLARMTQRGHQITCMNDLLEIYRDSNKKAISENLMTIPHDTLRRYNYITVAVTGCSTKCVSQLRTHAKRLTFLSTSTQYSSFESRDNNFVVPEGLNSSQEQIYRNVCYEIMQAYDVLLSLGVDKDKAGYLLPQSLRKAMVISGPLNEWQKVMQTRLCHRNTEETQYVMQLIKNKLEAVTYGKQFTVSMAPTCYNGKCEEGKFSCGKKYREPDEDA